MDKKRALIFRAILLSAGVLSAAAVLVIFHLAVEEAQRDKSAYLNISFLAFSLLVFFQGFSPLFKSKEAQEPGPGEFFTPFAGSGYLILNVLIFLTANVLIKDMAFKMNLILHIAAITLFFLSLSAAAAMSIFSSSVNETEKGLSNRLDEIKASAKTFHLEISDENIKAQAKKAADEIKYFSPSNRTEAIWIDKRLLDILKTETVMDFEKLKEFQKLIAKRKTL